jgi:hypothetical protein
MMVGTYDVTTTTTWLEKLLSQHSELESPTNFWLWGGLAAISAVVKDNIWIDRQIYNLYPNIYVMFHAESGLKKGPPISMAKQLVRGVGGTRIISGRSSIQGILKELGTAQTQPGGKVINKSTAFICSSELTSSIVEDKVATDILTDLYDRQYNIGEWRSLLKMESFNLKDPTITMLTATNEAHSSDFFGKKDIHGGYFARTFIISENKRNRANSLLVPLKNPPKYSEHIEYLKELEKLKGAFEPLATQELTEKHIFPYAEHVTGEMNYFTEAGLVYQKWYEEFVDKVLTSDLKDDTGTLNRFGDSVLKVAMLLALTRSPELYIDVNSMNLAIQYSEKLIGNVREMTHGKKGLSEAKNIKSLIIGEFLGREPHSISRPMLLKQLWSHYKEASELDEIMNSFDQAGMIKTQTIGNQIIYVMPESQVGELRKRFSGKGR